MYKESCVICLEGKHLFCGNCVDVLGEISHKHGFDYTKIVEGDQRKPDPTHHMRPLWDIVTSVNYDDGNIMGIEKAEVVNKVYGNEIRTIRTMHTLAKLSTT